MDCEVRIVTVDYYASKPNILDPIVSTFQQKNVYSVPIIRIFGATSQGQKCCLHVHGVFPYLLVKCPVGNPGVEFLGNFARSLDRAIDLSFNRKSTPVAKHYVYNVEKVELIPFYGYHADPELFLKVFLYNPQLVKRVADILQNGAVMNYKLQPHEIHIPYILKFFIDFHLYGMDFIRLRNVKFRSDSTESNDTDPVSSSLDAFLTSSQPIDPTKLPASCQMPVTEMRQSSCELEADVHCDDILNVKSGAGTATQAGSQLANPGLRFIWDDECLRRVEEGLPDSPPVEVLGDRPLAKPTTSDVYFADVFGEVFGRWKEAERNLENTAATGTESADTIIMEQSSCPDVDEQLVAQLSQVWDSDMSVSQNHDPSHQDNDDMHFSQLGEDDIALIKLLTELQRDSGMDDSESLEDGPGPSGISQAIPATPTVRRMSSAYMSSPLLAASQKSIGHLSQATPLSFHEDQGLTRVMEAPESHAGGDHDVIPGTPQTELFENNEERQLELEMSQVWEHENHSDDEDNAPPGPSVVTARPKNAVKKSADDHHRNKKIDLLDRSERSIAVSTFEPGLKPPTKFEVQKYINDINVEPTTPAPDSPALITAMVADGKGSDSDSNDSVISEDRLLERNGSDSDISISLDPIDIEQCHTRMALSQDSTIVEVPGSPDGLQSQPLIKATPKLNTKKRKNTEKPPKNEARLVKLRRHVTSNASMLDIATPENSFGFDISAPNLQEASKTNPSVHHLTVFSLELHIHTRGDLTPDPVYDSICAAFFTVYTDANTEEVDSGVVFCASSTIPTTIRRNRAKSFPRSFTRLKSRLSGDSHVDLVYAAETEELLIQKIVELVRRYDPDILVGFEIQMLSWGFLLERASHLKLDSCAAQLSRIPGESGHSSFKIDDDWWALSDLKMAGRVVLNLWRILRQEVTLNIYTFENVTYHVLKQRIPFYTHSQLALWCTENYIWRVASYFRLKTECNILLLLNCDLLGRTSELAKLFGIQFYEVLSRGSQFRVESMMLRMTRLEGFVAVSPSIQQRNKMAAPECIPLTMEPESKFYTCPVLVLDFRSLYPSIIIAYNYCYSTCLGKISKFGSCDEIQLGCQRLNLPFKKIKDVKNDLVFTPAGVAFVKSHIRRGILPRMLEEILQTRVMVKGALKRANTPDKAALRRLLDARQLGLKFIANFTYGYTSANFSGRMPCVEIADSIVHKARETLERAIKQVRTTDQWKANVVYGDTDSLFVELQGRSKAEAFVLGEEIVKAISEANPQPIKLQFEKVFYPCVLQTKKRYVGYAYESAGQVEPIFDAKGIETVRRDGCPAQSKVLEKALHTLFRTKDQICVREHVVRQFQKVYQNRLSTLDFVFAKEYRGRQGYKPTASVPALQIARKRQLRDPRAEPRIGERVPYVIVFGEPKATLISCVREPRDLIMNETLRINTEYYILKQLIPPLNRFLCLIGVDANKWYREMVKSNRGIYNLGLRNPAATSGVRGGQRTLSQFFGSAHCPVCGETRAVKPSAAGVELCEKCVTNGQSSAVELSAILIATDRRLQACNKLCGLCERSTGNKSKCLSIDCPVYWKRVRTLRDLERNKELSNCLKQL